jgi:hypothetical protein
VQSNPVVVAVLWEAACSNPDLDYGASLNAVHFAGSLRVGLRFLG